MQCDNRNKCLLSKLGHWQDQRFLWAIMFVAMVGLVIVAHSLFQNYIFMKPCEQCVYIRYAMLVMALGGVFALINPKNAILKIIAYVLALYGAIRGIMYSVKLDKIHEAVHGDDPFGVQGCSAVPSFDFNLPLHVWAPDWFLPTGDCGYDNPLIPDGVNLSSLQQWLVDFYADGWYLIPSSHFGNMAQCTLIAFGVSFVILALMLIGWIFNIKKGNCNE